MPHKLHLNMKIYFILLFIATFPYTALAGKPWLKKPLRYVCADSVITWGYDGRDVRTIASATDSTAQASTMVLTRQAWNNRHATYEAWCKQLPEHNCIGGAGYEKDPAQALAAAKWLNQAAQLFLMQGDACYMDYAERALMNAVMRTAVDTLQPKGSIDKWMAASLLKASPGLIYATTLNEKELYINLYTNATTPLMLQGKRLLLDQITDMPVSGGVKIRFSGFKGELKLKLHLRMPDWCGLRTGTPYIYIGGETQHPTLYVNGHEIEPLMINEKGYITIDRTWHSLDEVYIDLPLRVQTILPTSTPTDKQHAPIRDFVAYQYGPLVCLPQGNTKGRYFKPTQTPIFTNEYNAYNRPVLQGSMYKYIDAPQDGQAENETFVAE